MRKLAITVLALSISISAPVFGESRAGGSPLGLAIYNFGQINDTYFRGAEPNAKGFAALAQAGVKLVIDLQAEGNRKEPKMAEAAGIRYVRIPMTTQISPTPEQTAQFLALVGDPANQPVFVHCKEGRHRTGVMTAVYRMTNDGWTADKAFDEMKDYKFGWDFLHREFKRFVYAFKPSTVNPPATLAAKATASSGDSASVVAEPTAARPVAATEASASSVETTK